MKFLARSSDAAELLVRLKAVRPESARRWGRMSAHPMICHLADAFRMATGEKAVTDGATLFNRTILKWVALRLPLPWPGGRIATCREIDQEGGGTRPGDFGTDVVEVERLIGVITKGAVPLLPRHPIFGAMSRAEWLRWGYLHVDHHLRQFGA